MAVMGDAPNEAALGGAYLDEPLRQDTALTRFLHAPRDAQTRRAAAAIADEGLVVDRHEDVLPVALELDLVGREHAGVHGLVAVEQRDDLAAHPRAHALRRLRDGLQRNVVRCGAP